MRSSKGCDTGRAADTSHPSFPRKRESTTTSPVSNIILAGITTKGFRRAMKITDADHTNWRVKDVERSLGFYRDVLGLEPFGLEAYERGEHPLVSLRVTTDFILHLRPDSTFEPGSTGGYDHLALVVEETGTEKLAKYLSTSDVEVERRLE